MNNPQQQLNDFLMDHMLHPACYHWEEELERFMAEMDAVRNGKQGSVKMIPYWMGKPLFKPESVLAIDIGGTYVKSAWISLNESGVVEMKHLPPFLTPGVNDSMNSELFFQKIVAPIGSYLETEKIGICFSLATIPQKNRDAVVSASAKQLCVTDLLGVKVGQSFCKAADALGFRHDQEIVVINDTVAAMLSGRCEHQNLVYDGYIGFIYGTGTNLAYQEPGGELINIESGAYCGFPCGDIDDRFDASLVDAEQDRFEKMVSGGYQGGLMTAILQAAVNENLLSEDFYDRLFVTEDNPLTAEDISGFFRSDAAENRISLACTDQAERALLTSLFDAVTARSALLCSVTVTGALLRAQIGKTKLTPAYITAEGSTYQKQKGFRENLDTCMQQIAGNRFGLHYEFQTVRDAVLKGTALASLT